MKTIGVHINEIKESPNRAIEILRRLKKEGHTVVVIYSFEENHHTRAGRDKLIDICIWLFDNHFRHLFDYTEQEPSYSERVPIICTSSSKAIKKN